MPRMALKLALQLRTGPFDSSLHVKPTSIGIPGCSTPLFPPTYMSMVYIVVHHHGEITPSQKPRCTSQLAAQVLNEVHAAVAQDVRRRSRWPGANAKFSTRNLKCVNYK